MDNNLAERILRGVMLGRKNYWGNHSFLMGDFSSAFAKRDYGEVKISIANGVH